jgi:hypothetical protein
MKNLRTKRRLRAILLWTLWVLLAQLILINISAGMYAYKLTHLRTATNETWTKSAPANIFAKTWRLFSGPTFYKQAYQFARLSVFWIELRPVRHFHSGLV